VIPEQGTAALHVFFPRSRLYQILIQIVRTRLSARAARTSVARGDLTLPHSLGDERDVVRVRGSRNDEDHAWTADVRSENSAA